MPKYLIDVNLPYYFSLRNTPDFIHQKDIDDSWSDEQISQYAKQHNLIIITKDSDFSIKAFYQGSPPKVIHLKFGNLRMKDFHNVISKIWNEIEENAAEYNLVNVYVDRIESVR